MAVANSSDFSLTRNEIISEALELCGIIPVNSTPDTDKIESSSKSLNLIIKNIQNDGVRLWSIEEVTKTTTTEMSEFAVDTDTIDIQSAFVRVGNTDYPLQVISYNQYQMIQDKSISDGIPKYIVFDRKLLPIVRLYPKLTDITQTIHYLRVRKLKDYDNANNTSDAPVSWERVIVWLLAAEIAPKYGVPIDRLAYIERKASALYSQAIKSDTERIDSLFIEPAF